MINTKAKGTKAERELIHALHKDSWSAIRVAGSGSSRYPCPDILAGNGYRRLAFECKVTRDKKKYIPKADVEQLKIFARNFGAEAWIAVKFPSEDWYFFMIEDLEEKSASFAATLEGAQRKGFRLSELLENS